MDWLEPTSPYRLYSVLTFNVIGLSHKVQPAPQVTDASTKAKLLVFNLVLKKFLSWEFICCLFFMLFFFRFFFSFQFLFFFVKLFLF